MTDLEAISHQIEDQLRRVMVRTERLGSSPDRDGMLATAPVPDLIPQANDMVAFAATDALAQQIKAPAVQEDLLALMSQWYPEDELSDLVDRLRLDLSPRHS